MDLATHLEALAHELEQYKNRPEFAEQADAVRAEVARVTKLGRSDIAPAEDVEPEVEPVVDEPATEAPTVEPPATPAV